jgi:hypothetical protein
MFPLDATALPYLDRPPVGYAEAVEYSITAADGMYTLEPIPMNEIFLNPTLTQLVYNWVGFPKQSYWPTSVWSGTSYQDVGAACGQEFYPYAPLYDYSSQPGEQFQNMTQSPFAGSLSFSKGVCTQRAILIYTTDDVQFTAVDTSLGWENTGECTQSENARRE